MTPQDFSRISSFLWSVADLIRDPVKRGKCQDVILPLTALRCLDYVLARTKEKVLETHRRCPGRLRYRGPGTSRWTRAAVASR